MNKNADVPDETIGLHTLMGFQRCVDMFGPANLPTSVWHFLVSFPGET